MTLLGQLVIAGPQHHVAASCHDGHMNRTLKDASMKQSFRTYPDLNYLFNWWGKHGQRLSKLIAEQSFETSTKTLPSRR